MEPQNKKKIFIFLFLLLITQINSFSYQNIIHENSNSPKVISLEDKSVLVFLSIIGDNKCRETKLDKNGQKIYSYIYNNLSLSVNDKLASPHNSINKESILTHNDNSSNEIIKKLSQGNIASSLKITNSQYHSHKSIVSLKCGKIIIEGIYNDNEIIKVNANIYDSKTNTYGKGICFGENVKIVSSMNKKRIKFIVFIFQKKLL